MWWSSRSKVATMHGDSCQLWLLLYQALPCPLGPPLRLDITAGSMRLLVVAVRC